MARPPEFDADAVLETVMQLFCGRGCEATSVQDLVEATGLNRSSLYNRFGEKHALFLAALERYVQRNETRLQAVLEAPGPKKPALRRLLEGQIEANLSGAANGCLVANTTIELAPHDPEAARIIADNQARMEAVLHKALQEAQATGEIGLRHEPRALARFLYSMMQGLNVTLRATQDRALLQNIVDVALSCLD